MRILVLDDEEPRHKAFRQKLIGHVDLHVYTYDQCVAALRETAEPFDLAYLDHDLQDLVKDGTLVARFIAELPCERRPRRVIVHSANPAGRARMVAILTDAGVDTVAQPFAWVG